MSRTSGSWRYRAGEQHKPKVDRTVRVQCCNKLHKITLTPSGALVLHGHHDIGAELLLMKMAGTSVMPRCIQIVKLWRGSDNGGTRKVMPPELRLPHGARNKAKRGFHEPSHEYTLSDGRAVSPMVWIHHVSQAGSWRPANLSISLPFRWAAQARIIHDFIRVLREAFPALHIDEALTGCGVSNYRFQPFFRTVYTNPDVLRFNGSVSIQWWLKTRSLSAHLREFHHGMFFGWVKDFPSISKGDDGCFLALTMYEGNLEAWRFRPDGGGGWVRDRAEWRLTE